MICPNIHLKEVRDGFNEMVEAFGGKPLTDEEFKSSELRDQRTGLDYAAMEAAYRCYHKNNGNMLDKAPNGKDSVLFNSLLEYFGNRAQAIKAKSNVYSDEFLGRFGDWTSNVNDFNLNDIDYSKVDVEEHEKLWKDDPTKSNRTIRIYLKDQHEKGYFELVKDHETGYFSVHFKTSKEGAEYNSPSTEYTTKEERKILFEELVKAIPNGARVSTWGSLSEDGIKGLNNVGRNMVKVGERKVTLKSNGNETNIPIYRKGSDISKTVDENGEPLVEHVLPKRQISVKLDDLMAHLSYQSSSQQKKPETIRENKQRLLSYYIQDNGIIAQAKREIDSLKKDAEKSLGKGVFYDSENADTEEEKDDKVEKKIKEINAILKDAGYAYSFPLKGKAIGGIKVSIKMKTPEQLAEKRIMDYLNEMSPSDLYHACMDLELQENWMAHINPKKIQSIRAQILKKSFLYNDEHVVDQVIEFLKNQPDTREDNMLVECIIKWVKNDTISVFRDFYKIKPIFNTARQHNIDVQKFKSPYELIKAVLDLHIKEESTPLTKLEKYTHIRYSHSQMMGDQTVDVYDVEDSEDGQQNVCQMLADSNPKINGKPLEYSPWCLSTFTVNTNGVAKPSPSAKRFWDTYQRGRRQIALCGGFPVAFNSSKRAEDFWWDYFDSPGTTGNLKDLETSSRETILSQKIDAKRRVDEIGPYKLIDDGIIVFSAGELKISVHKITGRIVIKKNNDITLSLYKSARTIDFDDLMYDLAFEIARLLDARIRSIKDILNSSQYFKDQLSTFHDYAQNLLNRINIDSIPLDLKTLNNIIDKYVELVEECSNAVKNEDIYFKKPEFLGQLSDLEYMPEEEFDYYFGPNPIQDPAMIDRQVAEDTAREIVETDHLWRKYEETLAQPVRNELSQLLKSILRRYHFEIVEDDLTQIFGDDVLGMFDYLNKVVYLSNTGNANAISDTEEFCHAFIKMMGSAYHLKANRSKYPHTRLYSDLRDLLVKTNFYKHVFEEYKDVYVFQNGQPNLPKIKEEAMGKALAAVLNERWQVHQEADESFFKKLKLWFNNVLKWIKHLICKSDKYALDNLSYELEKIADSIIDGSYAKKYLDKVDRSQYRQVTLDESIQRSIEEDGGVAVQILRTLQNLGGIVSGSMSFRNQTPVFRKNADALHDLDVAFPLNMHHLHEMFSSNPLHYPSLYYVGPNNYFNQRVLEAAFSANPAVSNIFNTMRQQYPGFQIMYAYPASQNVVVNCIICEDQNIVDRFKQMTGSFDRRLAQFTEDERSRIRLVDMFFNHDSTIAEDSVLDGTYGLKMANYKHSFKEKMKYGRAKDIFDYQNLDPINRIVYSRQSNVTINNAPGLMAHVNSGSTQQADKIRKSAENIRHRFGVLYKAYEKMPNKSPQRQKHANEIFELYGEIKRIDNFDAVTKAMDFAERKLGLLDDSDQHPGILQWLKKKEETDFAGVSAENVVDVMQNTIGFFRDLLTYFPPDSYMTDKAIEQRNKISGSIENTIIPLWTKAVYTVSDRIVDSLVNRWFTGSDEDAAGMKEVAKDWLHKNSMYGDINSMAAFLQNYQYSENPITKQVFHLIQVAETKTGMELQPIAAKISKAYAKANKEFGKFNPAWQRIFMEFDENGVPTGNFVRDINYGQYQKDVDAFISELNERFQTKYGHSYYIDEDGTYINTLTGGFADDEEWENGNPPHIVEYKLEIERFRCERSYRRYTYQYYKERMSEPYSGPDPVLTNLSGDFKHGLSPRTLSKYNRIQSNINYYMSLCYDKESGISHPEDLSPQDYSKLEQFRKELEELSNPYTEAGTVKTGEDYQSAIEIRAWEKWIGEKLETNVDVDKFWEEANRILAEKGPQAYDRFIQYNSKIGINPNLIAQTIGQFGSSDAYAEAIHAKLLRSSLQRLVQSKQGYTRDLSKQEDNPQFWIDCKTTDQIIEDNRTKRGKDFALMFSNTFSNDLIIYRDEYGNALDLNGNVVPRDKESDTQLLTWFDYMIRKYTAWVANSPSKTIPGLFDKSTGALYVFTGTNQEIERQIRALFTYKRVVHDEDGTSHIEREPLSIFTLLTPLQDTFVNQKTGKVEQSIGIIPSGAFSSKKDSRNMYLTDPNEFDYNSPITEQPKRTLYDNTEAFSKVRGSAKELYDVLTEVCANTQQIYKQSKSQFNWRLPMINAQAMAILSRLKRDGYRNVSRAIFDEISSITENDENMRTSDQFATNPDGTVATDIPLKFIRPLKDMSRLSTDISSMVVLFAEMGLNYKNKQEIASTVAALRYNMDSDIRKHQSRQSDEEYQIGENKDATEQFDNMTTIHLYGNDWHFKKDKNAPYNRGIVAGQKIAKLIQRYESTHMLGLNILSMLVGACDAGVKQFREVLNGKYARPQDMIKGFIRCIEHTPKAIANIGCPLANNKFTALMQMLRISKGTRATYEHMNWSRFKKIGAQFLMGGFSMLDYMMNGLLLMTHMSNVRLYNEDGHDSEIKPGFYTLYELQQQFIKVGRKKSEATLTHLMLHEDLYNAFEFSAQDGTCYIKDKYKAYVNDDLFTSVRTKTISRGALYNGMNPDNDQPKARKKVWSSFLLSMRGWITQSIQHLISGGTDNIPVKQKQTSELLTRYGITKLIPSISREPLTNEQRSRKQAWNYETGTPQDQIFVGLARSFKTLYRYIRMHSWNIPEGDPDKVKFSYVEKYAAKDALMWLIVLGAMLATWPIVNNLAGDVPPPKEDDPKLLDDPYRYMVDVYFPNEYYKLMLADVYFRTIESQISSVDPTTMMDFVTSASVLYSAYNEQADFLMAGTDLLGFGDGSIDSKVKTGGYKNYTKRTRVFAKGVGFLDNIHTAFDFYGMDANLKFYTGKYGGIYRWLGYDYKRRYGRLNVGYSTKKDGPGLMGSGPGLGSDAPGLSGGPGLGSDGPGL